MNIKQIIKEEMEDLTKTKKLYVLVGPPSVGKSTWIKTLQADNIVINRDDIVERIAETNGLTYDEMFVNPSPESSVIGDVDPKYGEVIEAPEHMLKWTDLAYSKIVKLNGYVQYLLTTSVEQAINSDKHIVVDMTNMNKGSRKRALKYLGDKSDEYEKIAVVFKFQGSEDIIKKVANIRAQQYRDAGKSKTIGNEVFDMMFKSYEEPTMEEGFDDIIHVDNTRQLELVIKDNENQQIKK